MLLNQRYVIYTFWSFQLNWRHVQYILFTISNKAAIINLRMACDLDIGTNKSSKVFHKGRALINVLDLSWQNVKLFEALTYFSFK